MSSSKILAHNSINGGFDFVTCNQQGQLLVSVVNPSLTVFDSSVETQLIANNTVLSTIAETETISSSYLQGILTKSTPLQRQTAEYNISAAATLAPDSSPLLTAPPIGLPLSAGWYYKNTGGSQACQIYYYSYINLLFQVPQRQATYLIGDITGGWAIIRPLNLSSTAGLPFLVKYSRPTGSGDFTAWYKSRWVYTIPTSAKLTQGQEILVFWGVIPDPRIFPTVRRVALELSTTVGTASNNETLAYLSLNSDSLANINHTDFCVRAAGWIYGGQEITESIFTGAQQTELTATNTVLSTINTQLTTSNVVLTGISNKLNAPILISREQYGSYGNVLSNGTLTPQSYTDSVGIANWGYVMGYYQDTNTSSFDAIQCFISFDNVNWIESQNSIFPAVSGSFRRGFLTKTDIPAINFIRFKNTSDTNTLTNVYISLTGASL